MKNIFLLFGLVLCMSLTPQKTSAQNATISFQDFYDELSPYGTWYDNPEYGYVWLPDAGIGFVPYASNGNWVYTDLGWTWASNYDWGWAPFHYGRWFTDQVFGPMWVPDTEWGPAWVSWRQSNDYYGWAALEPGISINDADSKSYNIPYDQWTFVRSSDFGRSKIDNYYADWTISRSILSSSSVIHNVQTDNARNITYNAGPEISELDKVYGKNMNPLTITDLNKPGQKVNNNELEMYRPKVQKIAATGLVPAPARFSTLRDWEPLTHEDVVMQK